MKIPENILAVLAESEIRDNTLFLPPVKLERNTYETVNKCVASIGGKWNRKAKGHVFDYDPSEAMENLIATGETEDMKKKFQFFPTPRPVAEMICDMAELTPCSRVLEPSCGKGDIMDVVYERGIHEIVGVELNKDMKVYLSNKPYTTMIGIDFLDFAADPNHKRDWSHVIMNPPFTKQQDIDHIRAAYGVLAPGGVLVSILSPSPFFRQNRKSVKFRQWLKELGAEVDDIPAGAFKESGTCIATKIIKIRRTAPCASSTSARE